MYVGDIIEDEKENRRLSEKPRAIVKISDASGYAGMFYYQYLPHSPHMNPLDAFLYREPKENRKEEIDNPLFPLFKVIGNEFENPELLKNA